MMISIVFVFFLPIMSKCFSSDQAANNSFLKQCLNSFKTKREISDFSFFQTSSVKIKPKFIKITGDFVFGGLFPMHDSGDEVNFCGAIKEDKGIQRLEAMLYTIDMINRNDNLLPNYTIGAHILDTCSRDTYALEQAMEFVKLSFTTVNHAIDQYQCDDGSIPHHVMTEPVVGVIGAASSSVSVMVANILRLFQIPQISYASTSVELSDKTRFGYFSRVVPPDNFQAQVMVDILKLFNWTYVSTIAEEGDYGEKGIEYFKQLASKENICIAESVKIHLNTKPEEFIRIVKQLNSKPNARGVVLFVDEDNCRKLLNATRSVGQFGRFFWIGSDSWGRKLYPVKGQEDVAVGAITILPKRKPLEGFDEYFKNLKPKTNKRNPWFLSFWEQHFNCRVTDDSYSNLMLKQCTGDEVLVKYEQEGLVPFVADAVYALAHAIQNLLKDKCPGNESKTSCIKTSVKGPDLLSYIRKLSFEGRQGGIVKFNKDGDAVGRYDIFQYQRVKRSLRNYDEEKDRSRFKCDYINIGDWENDKLTFDLQKLEWPFFKQIKENSIVPSSVCSKQCDRGQFRQIHEGQSCCWHCSYCKENERTYNDTECIACPIGFIPDEYQETCVKLPVEYMKWSSPWVYVPASFAFLGIIFTLFTAIIFIRFNSTPVIMASGRELCYILLSGLVLCHIISLIILAKPTFITCIIIRIGLNLGLCISYSAILTKTNRISRIFNRDSKNGLKWPSYTSPKSQVVICICLVSVQLIFIVSWLIRDLPSIKEVVYKVGSRKFAFLQCEISSFSVTISLIYNMVLILLCTTYAFKTRKIPDDFNETKYIVFTMYSTCIVWLAFIPIYFGTKNDVTIQISSLSTCLSISAAVNWGCLFTPKLYICLFQPYKNVRTSGSKTNASSMQVFTSNSAFRFIRPTTSTAIECAMITSPFNETMTIDEGLSKNSFLQGSVDKHKLANSNEELASSSYKNLTTQKLFQSYKEKQNI